MKELDVLAKLKREIEEYDDIIESINKDIEETEPYEISLRDKLQGRIATLKRGRTEAVRVYQDTSDMAKQFEGVTEFKRFIAHIDSIETPYTRDEGGDD